MSTPGMVPMFDPATGRLGDVPYNRMAEARQKGGLIPGVHVLDAQGNPGVIPANRMQEFLASEKGAKLVPFSEQPVQHEGFWSSLLGDLGAAAKSLPGTAAALGAFVTDVPPTLQRKIGITPLEETVGQQVKNVPAEWQQRKQAGYSVPYRIAAPPLEVMGVNVPGMEQAAQQGDVRGVAGHMAAGQAMAAAPLLTEGLVRGANRVVPSTTRAGAGLSALVERYGEHPIEPTNATATIARFEKELEPTPSVKVPPIIRDFQDRLLRTNPAAKSTVAAKLEASGIPMGNPLTFAESRSFLKRINEARTGSGDIHDNMLKATAQALSDDIQAGVAKPSAVAPQGFANDYTRMINEYRHGSQAIRVGNEAGPILGAALGYEAGRAAGQPWGGTLLGGMAGRYLGKETVGRGVEAIIKRKGGAPNISAPPRPPVTEATPTSAYTRILLDAKEGNISPGEANRRITKLGGKVAVRPLPEQE